MTGNRIRQRLRQGQTAFGVNVLVGDPAIIELIGLGGFDAAFIDMEHSAIELALVEHLTRAAEVVGISANVRVPDLVTVGRVLDLGVQAITVPRVRTRSEAMEAVAATRYPPLGRRGISPTSRAGRYGAVSWPEAERIGNEEVVLCLQVEDQHGVDNLEDIASVDGVDIVYIGPSDLAAALGIAQPNDPRLRTVVEGIAATLKRVARARLGFPYNHPTLAITPAELRDWGVCYSNVGPTIQRVLLSHFQETILKLRGPIADP